MPRVEHGVMANLPLNPSHSDFSRPNDVPFRYSSQLPDSGVRSQLARATREAEVVRVSEDFGSSLRPQATATIMAAETVATPRKAFMTTKDSYAGGPNCFPEPSAVIRRE